MRTELRYQTEFTYNVDKAACTEHLYTKFPTQHSVLAQIDPGKIPAVFTAFASTDS